MTLRQTHGHIEVVGTAGQGPVKDRHHETRVDGVDHMRNPPVAHKRRDSVSRTGVDADGTETRIAHCVGGLLSLSPVIIGHDDVFEEVPPHGDRTEGGADAACAHQKNPHGKNGTHFTAVPQAYTATSKPAMPRRVTLGL